MPIKSSKNFWNSKEKKKESNLVETDLQDPPFDSTIYFFIVFRNNLVNYYISLDFLSYQ